MRYLAIITTMTMTIFFVGCARNPRYIAQDQTAHPMTIPVNTRVKQAASYYPVPNNTPSVAQSPSLVPPGSNLQRFKNQSQRQLNSNKKLATLQQNNNGSPVLIVSEKQNQAWAQIGRALQKTPYQILDQDSSLSSYYVLDIESTNNKITKTTPIYRVYLKSNGNQTQVVLLNKDNQPAAKDVTQRILMAIQQKFV